VGPSYYRQGAAGLGWPDGSLVPEAKGIALTGTAGVGVGGLGWPDAGAGTDPGSSTGHGSGGVQVKGERSAIVTVENAADAGRPDMPAPPVVIPDIPRNQVDTPIGRAAEAAVGVRGLADRQTWPRPPRCPYSALSSRTYNPLPLSSSTRADSPTQNALWRSSARSAPAFPFSIAAPAIDSSAAATTPRWTCSSRLK